MSQKSNCKVTNKDEISNIWECLYIISWFSFDPDDGVLLRWSLTRLEPLEAEVLKVVYSITESCLVAVIPIVAL